MVGYTAVNHQRKDLWEAQKRSEEGRMEWLQGEAMERAKAAGDSDWGSGLQQTIRVAKSRATNRKLGAIIKGRQSTLDRIEVPIHDWFYSKKANEVYHYDAGSFEAYPAVGDGMYFPHHTLKVLPPDADLALVKTLQDGKYRVQHVLTWFVSRPKKDGHPADQGEELVS